jgi:uncharacterized protein YkwD
MNRPMACTALTALGVCLAVPLSFAQQQSDPARLDRNEAKKAFAYLNDIRRDPAAHGREAGADLTAIKARPPLVWNAILAKVAEAKALDMATRDYTAHVTPEGVGINRLIHEAGYQLAAYLRRDKKDNYFESLAWGALSGKGAIRLLILDKVDANLGHRKHLLGLDKFHTDSRDAGIGFARAPTGRYEAYVCVIIARHE